MQRTQPLQKKLTANARSRLNTWQVRIVPNPPPKNLAQSRQILAAIQKFGEVTTFRNLKYEIMNDNPFRDHTILVRFDSKESADRARAASPLHVALSTENYPSHLTSASNTTPSQMMPTSEKETPKEIVCQIDDSYHDHLSSLKRNPFFGTYNLPMQGGDAVYNDMLSKETGVPLKQLADTLQSRKFPISMDIKRRIWHVNTRIGGTSLMDLWEEGNMSENEKQQLANNQKEREAELRIQRLENEIKQREKVVAKQEMQAKVEEERSAKGATAERHDADATE